MNAGIVHLNDAFRTAVTAGCVVITRGVAIRGVPFQVAALAAVRRFTDFGRADDPCSEHDIGSFQIDDQHLMWEIDVYADTILSARGDPADPAAVRILTIMLATEY